jgi:hypothetical protein
MSVGNTPNSRNPSRNESPGVAVWSLPIHLGGSAVLRVRKTCTPAATSSTRTMTSRVSSEPPSRGTPLLAR